MDSITLNFDNYQITQLELKDIEALAKYTNNYNVSRFLRDTFPFPYTEGNAFNWIDSVNKNNLSLSFAIANDQELIGGIGAMPNQIVNNRFTGEIG